MLIVTTIHNIPALQPGYEAKNVAGHMSRCLCHIHIQSVTAVLQEYPPEVTGTRDGLALWTEFLCSLEKRSKVKVYIDFVTPLNELTNQGLQPALLTEDMPTLH